MFSILCTYPLVQSRHIHTHTKHPNEKGKLNALIKKTDEGVAKTKRKKIMNTNVVQSLTSIKCNYNNCANVAINGEQRMVTGYLSQVKKRKFSREN